MISSTEIASFFAMTRFYNFLLPHHLYPDRSSVILTVLMVLYLTGCLPDYPKIFGRIICQLVFILIFILHGINQSNLEDV
jgi:hypothetical protein